MLTEKIERRARALSGLPRPVDRSRTWWQRALRNPWTWITLLLFIGYAVALWHMYESFGGSLKNEIRAVTEQLNSPTELTTRQLNEAIKGSAGAAVWTLVAWFGLFSLYDRLRPTTMVMKLLALGWGAAVAIVISWYLNTWVSTLINVQGAGDPSSASRAAIFVAPFVEEASKASIVFLLAMAMRFRFVTAFQGITMAGLSGIGFAFTENVGYYSRAFIYASKIQGVNPEEARQQLVMLRGVYTSFGHPLFTTFVGIGIFVAVRTRSKVVRIIAPLSGFVVAAAGHMLFNGFASTSNEYRMLVGMGVVAIIFLLVWSFRQRKAERRQIATRLTDFVQMGWLMPRDPEVFSSGMARSKLAVSGLLRGRRVFVDTLKLQNRITELAYLRSWMVHGTIDAIGNERARELLLEIRDLRATALAEPVGLTIKPDTWRVRGRVQNLLSRLSLPRRRPRAQLPPPQSLPRPAYPPDGYPQPVGAGWGAPVGSAVPLRP